MDSNEIPPQLPPEPPFSSPPIVPASASPLRRLVALLLTLCLILFLASAFLSFADTSLGLLFGSHALSGLQGLVFFFSMLTAIAVYVLMALTPMVPKRWFVPVTLFSPIAGLLSVPFLIYYSHRAEWISWTFALAQIVIGLAVLRSVLRRGCSSPANAAPNTVQRLFSIVSPSHLNPRGFSWLNLLAFVSANLFVLVPAVLAYLFFSASLAVGHLSEGFVRLHPSGVTVQTRKYTRDDGKVVQLIPMAHVGDADFYRKLAGSFPSNSVILMEGVSDNKNLLTNKVSYHRMAQALGLSEQQKEFKPVAGEWITADVDISDFAPTTIDLLNLAMLVHKNGFTPQTMIPLLQYAPPPEIQTQVWDDLLHKRNRHLLAELHSHLADSDHIIIPWGAAHMPEISREVQKAGFHLSETHDFQVVRFGSKHRQRARSDGKEN